MDPSQNSTTKPVLPAQLSLPSATQPKLESKRLTIRVNFRLFVLIFSTFFLCYLVGAAVMFFQFPSSEFLSKSFMGIRAWAETHQENTQSNDKKSITALSTIDQPGKTYDGYTLFVCAAEGLTNRKISLINMQREVVNEWNVSFAKIWPNPPQLQGRHVVDSQVCVFACHLYGNGDLLVVFHSLELTVRGYGLAKLDRDSKLIWSYAANVHHDVVVGDDGTIYTLIQRPVTSIPKGLEAVPPPWLVDYLVMLSPDGKELIEPISLLEVFQNSPYSTLLSPLETSAKSTPPQATTDEALRELRQRQDVLHANSVNVLNATQAAQFPNLKPGQVLVSLRNLNALGVIDPTTRSLVWATTGPWRAQHDAQFLDNGNLLIFDNSGSPRGSRVLEYNPRNSTFPWTYPGVENRPFYTKIRGMCQRLPNGNTLIVDTEENQIFEVTAEKETVWNCLTPFHVLTARRYRPEQLAFLKNQRARN